MRERKKEKKQATTQKVHSDFSRVDAKVRDGATLEEDDNRQAHPALVHQAHPPQAPPPAQAIAQRRDRRPKSPSRPPCRLEASLADKGTGKGKIENAGMESSSSTNNNNSAPPVRQLQYRPCKGHPVGMGKSGGKGKMMATECDLRGDMMKGGKGMMVNHQMNGPYSKGDMMKGGKGMMMHPPPHMMGDMMKGGKEMMHAMSMVAQGMALMAQQQQYFHNEFYAEEMRYRHGH